MMSRAVDFSIVHMMKTAVMTMKTAVTTKTSIVGFGPERTVRPTPSQGALDS